MGKWSIATGAILLALLAVGAFVTQMYVAGHDRLLGLCQTGGVAGLVILGFLWSRRIKSTDATGDFIVGGQAMRHAEHLGHGGEGHGGEGDGSST